MRRRYARRDDLHPTQPEGRKIVAQCAGTGRRMVTAPAPGPGRKNQRGGPFFRPVPGLPNTARATHGCRRGLLSFALRAVRGIPRWVSEDVGYIISDDERDA